MNLYFNGRSAILLTILLQAIITSILLFYRGKTNKKTSDFILGLLVLFLGISSTDFILGFLGVYDKYPQLTFFPFENLFLIVSLIYLFSLSILQLEKPENIARHLIIPTLYLFTHLLVWLLPYEYKQQWLSKYYFPFIVYIETLLFYILSAYYFIDLFQKLKQHRYLSSNAYSGIQNSTINWLNYFLVGFAVYLIIDFILSIASEFFNFNFEQQYYKHLIRALLTSFLCLAGYSFREDVHIPITELNKKRDSEKQQKLLTDDGLEKNKEIVSTYFSENKPHLNPALTLKELADGLNMNSNTLSYVINNAYQQNFNDFVNTHRVNELIEKMKNPANVRFTLLSIAFDSGFNSKSTFNRVFKKLTKKSPNEFWEEIKTNS